MCVFGVVCIEFTRVVVCSMFCDVCCVLSVVLFLRKVLESTVSQVDGRLYYAQPKYCTDNGAMIAYAGCQRLLAGHASELNIDVRPRWSLENLNPL